MRNYRFYRTIAVLLLVWIGFVVYVSAVLFDRSRGAERFVNVVDPSGGRLYCVPGGLTSPNQPPGIGFIPPAQKSGSKRDSRESETEGFSLVRQSGFLKPYSLPPDSYCFTADSKPVFIGVAPRLGTPIQPTVIRRVEQAEKKVALTFDTGTMKEPLMRLLIDKLTELRVPATFFVCGAWCLNNRELLRMMVRRGFEIASHSLTHAWFTRISDADIENELKQTEALVREVSGNDIAAYFRPPFGAWDDRVSKVVARCGYLMIMWSKDARDWDVKVPPSQIISNAISNLRNGDIILMHTLGGNTVSVLPQLAANIRAKGFEVTTISGLLGSE